MITCDACFSPTWLAAQQPEADGAGGICKPSQRGSRELAAVGPTGGGPEAAELPGIPAGGAS